MSYVPREGVRGGGLARQGCGTRQQDSIAGLHASVKASRSLDYSWCAMRCNVSAFVR